MRAYSAANPERRVTERAPSRVEIAEIARGDMAAALQRLVLLIHTTRSDMAAVQAFVALKDIAYGRDPQTIDMHLDYEGMTEDELRAAIAAELAAGPTDPTGGGNDGGASPPPLAG